MHSGGKDPRFEATIGGKAFSKDDFGRRYAFLFDDVLPAERSELKKQLKVRARLSVC
jgi:ribosomal RNA-processing protein 36